MNRNYSFIICIIIICFIINFSFAASPYNLRIWKSSDGLGETNCNWISIDDLGNVLTTHGPVASMSYITGYEVQSIPIERHLEFRYSILYGNKIWVNKPSSEIGVYDLSTKEWKISKYNGPHLFNNMTMAPISSDSVILLSTDIIRRFDISTNKTTIILHASQSVIAPFLHTIPSEDGEILITGQGGLAKLRFEYSNVSQPPLITNFPFNKESGLKNLTYPLSGNGNSVFGRAYIQGGTKALVFLQGKQWKVLHESPEFGRGGGINDNDYWFYDYNRKLNLYHLNHYKLGIVTTADQEIPGNLDFKVDEDESLWVATFRGVKRYSKHTWNVPKDLDKSSLFLVSILEDERGIIWFLNQNFLIQYNNGSWKEHRLPKDFLHSQYATQNLGSTQTGKIVIGGLPNTLFFDPASEQFEYSQISQKGISIINTQDNGDIFSHVITERWKNYSLCILSGDEFEPILELKDKWNIGELRYVYQDRDNNLWIGGMGDQRLALYKEGKYQTFGDQYPSDSAMCILQLDNSKMWFSSRKDLVEYDGNEFYVIRKGVDSISSMIKSKKDGSVWLASWNGLYRYHDGAWITYTKEDGLPSSGIMKVFEDSNGRIWVGTQEGRIAYYDPSADPDPPKAILHPEENVSEISPGGEARFVYSGIDKWKYVQAGRLLYSHRIDDGEWSKFSQSTLASYEGLHSGAHHFQVRAMDIHLNVSTDTETFDFVVLKHWYMEPMFLCIISISSLLTLIFLGYAINRHLKINHYAHNLESTNNQLNEANLDLQEANAQLIQLDQMKTQFVSQASHDLRTPLTAIKGSLDNLLMGIAGVLNEKQAKIMTRATTSVDRLTNLINDVLDLNRIETGRIILEKTDIPFKALVENIVNENLPAAEQKRIQLNFDATDGDFMLSIDGSKIERVVGELISNAIKYTPENGTVDIDLKQNDQKITLSVKDSGIGMTNEECSKIWERFYRTSASQKFAKGSGLGLSIAKELVELHEGTLSVESEPGYGTTFLLELS